MLDNEISGAWERVRRHQGLPEETESLAAWKLARRRRKDFLKGSRKRFVSEQIRDMQQSMNLGDWHSFYRSLRSLGVPVEGVNYSGAAPFSLDTLRAHNMTVSSQALKVEDGFIRQQVKQRPVRHELGLTPSRAEFNQALEAVRESSPGKDGVTINMLRLAGD